MGNERFDLYTEVHKGLRRELCSWIGRLGRLNAENREDIAQARSDFDGLAALLATHAGHEEKWVHPYLAKCAPELSDDLEREHEETDVLFDAAADAFDSLAESSTAESWGLQQELYRKFSVFTGQYLTHLAREENEAMRVLQEHHSDDELMALSGQLLGSIPPDVMAKFLTVMIPAMSVKERVIMLGGMKETAPPPAFEGVCGLAANVLSPAEWTDVRGRVGIA